MKIEEVKKNFNATKEGIRIVKVAAFCFAIVSFIATAEGLREYVFTDSSWQAILISFGIQSILFVLNLKLPEYFDRIGEISSKGNRKHRKYHFGKQRGQEKKHIAGLLSRELCPCFIYCLCLCPHFFLLYISVIMLFTSTLVVTPTTIQFYQIYMEMYSVRWKDISKKTLKWCN